MGKEEIKQKLAKAVGSCPHKNAIRSLAIFGSYVNGVPGINSDLDVLVEFVPDVSIGLFEYVRIQRALGQYVGVRVDMVDKRGLSKFIREQVIKEAEIVYQG